MKDESFMKKIINLKCSGCGAVLSDENEGVMFCKFCGLKLKIDNDNEHIHKKIDVADVKRAETEQLVKLKQLEMKEKEIEHQKALLRIKIKSSIILVVIGIIMMVLGFACGSATGDSDSAWYMVAMIGMFLLMGSTYIWSFSIITNSKKKDDDVFNN